MSHRGRPTQTSELEVKINHKRSTAGVVFDFLYPGLLAILMIVVAYWFGLIEDQHLRAWMPEFFWRRFM